MENCNGDEAAEQYVMQCTNVSYDMHLLSAYRTVIIKTYLPDIFHQDLPVLIAKEMKTISYTVNSVMRNGIQLNKNQKYNLWTFLQ